MLEGLDHPRLLSSLPDDVAKPRPPARSQLPAAPTALPLQQPAAESRSVTSRAATGDVDGTVSGASLGNAAATVGRGSVQAMLGVRAHARRLERDSSDRSRRPLAAKADVLADVKERLLWSRLPDVEAKRQTIRLAGLATLLEHATGRRFSLDALRTLFAGKAAIKTTAAIVVPDRVLPHQRFIPNAKDDENRTNFRFNTRLKVQERTVVMTQAEKTLESHRVGAPLFFMDPEIFDDLQARQPEVIAGLEKLIAYASHDQFHTLFDDAWQGNVPSTIDRVGDFTWDRYEKGFTPNFYEYFLFAVARETFELADPRYRARVLGDAHLFIDAVEAYQQKLRAVPADERPSDEDIAKRGAYLLSVGIAKNLFFLFDPGDGPGAAMPARSHTHGAACVALEQALRERIAGHPHLWNNLHLQRAAHAPALTLRRKPVTVGQVAAIYLGASTFPHLDLSLELAAQVAGETPDSIIDKLAEHADGGSQAALDALTSAGLRVWLGYHLGRARVSQLLANLFSGVGAAFGHR